MKSQGVFRVKSPAKINPYLHIIEKNNDGYHDLCLSLVPVSLYDVLIFAENKTPLVHLEVQGADDLGPPGTNLVTRAAQAFFQATGLPSGVSIQLHKQIPHGAGLGGGSGNAACVLQVLNHQHGYPLSSQDLAALALTLGTDVPFFLEPKPSLGQGRGEQLSPLPHFPHWELLIVKPAFSISTAQAYGWCKPRGRVQPCHAANPTHNPALLENDFEAALFPRYPQLAEIKAALLAQGAQGALLCGSGSAVFGVFAHATARDNAHQILAQHPDWCLWPCHTLSTHSYGAT